MSCGIPVIASRIIGIPEIIENDKNGLLVSARDSKELADATIYLLENDELRKRMGKNGREKVKAYSWEKLAKDTEKIYEKVLIG